jgi:hypothetical protein
MYEEKRTRTWETLIVPDITGKPTQRLKGGWLMIFRESYSLIVLRDGRADYMGKG